MKPARLRVLTSSRSHITLEWDSCDSLILKPIEGRVEDDRSVAEDPGEGGDEENRRWYWLERRDRVLGWSNVYMGFKTETKVGPMTPGDYHEFRLKVKTKRLESDWSDVLFALTKDDFVPVSQLHRAVENGSVKTLRKILGQRISLVDVPNRFGKTSFMLAVAKNDPNAMAILLNHGAELENSETGSGKTPLMAAAAGGHLEAMHFLLEKGSSWKTKDRNGLTAFNYAVDNSQLSVVRLAVEKGVDLSTKDNSGWSPLMRGVVLKSSVEVLSHLLDNGCDPNERDDRRQTILMQAVLSGNPEVVHLLLEKGADSEVRNIYGHSAYDMAKNSSNEAILKLTHLLGSEPEKKPRKSENGARRDAVGK